MIEIKDWRTLEVIVSVEVTTIREAVEYAAKTGAYLRGADLGGADLGGAYLVGADLGGADLGGAYLGGANLGGANLGGATLRYATLTGANLGGAYLRGAYLGGANLGGANLVGATLRYATLGGANLVGATLRYATLTGANLVDADLADADLTGATLVGANLTGADLGGADLRGADLRGANLRGAKGIIPQQYSPLLMLLEQPALIRAYKLVKPNGEGPYAGGVYYRVGESYEVGDAETDPDIACGAGINVATLDWCLREWVQGYRILVVEFTKKDIAAIPYGTDGKFRLKKCKVVREIDLKTELNWPLKMSRD